MNIPSEEIQQNLFKMQQVLKDCDHLFILTHDNPDPDSVSSAIALAALVRERFQMKATVGYGGIVGRAENRAMIRHLNLKIKKVSKKDLKSNKYFALVDTQPNTGNNSLPASVKPIIVIDHHPQRSSTKADFVDIREGYGATATILTEYLVESGIEITSQVATALAYGLISETQNLGRGASEKDLAAYVALFPKINKKALSKIEYPRLGRPYFLSIDKALHRALIYKNAIVTTLGEISNPDLVPLVADFLLRFERMSWSMCLGRYNRRIIVSIRTTRQRAQAGALLKRLVGRKGDAGGHEMIAGGQVYCSKIENEDKCNELEQELIQGFLKRIGYKDVDEMTSLLADEPASVKS